MPATAVLFDLDGTLLDTAPDFIAAIKKLIKRHQLTDVSEDIIRSQVSNGGRALTELIFNIKRTEPEFPPLFHELLNDYENVMGQYCVFF